MHDLKVLLQKLVQPATWRMSSPCGARTAMPTRRTGTGAALAPATGPSSAPCLRFTPRGPGLCPAGGRRAGPSRPVEGAGTRGRQRLAEPRAQPVTAVSSAKCSVCRRPSESVTIRCSSRPTPDRPIPRRRPRRCCGRRGPAVREGLRWMQRLDRSAGRGRVRHAPAGPTAAPLARLGGQGGRRSCERDADVPRRSRPRRVRLQWGAAARTTDGGPRGRG